MREKISGILPTDRENLRRQINSFFLGSERTNSRTRLIVGVVALLGLACSDNTSFPPASMGGGQSPGEMPGISIGGISAGGGVVEYPDECLIGERLGICATCSPSREPVMPINDDECPFVDCSPLTQYQAMNTEDGGRTCFEFVSNPPETSCKSLGECYSDIEESCTLDPTPVPLVTVYPGCGEFTGCEGGLGPDGSTAPVGSVCHGLGQCGADGRCSAPSSCAGIQPEYVTQFCADNSEPEACDKHIDLNGVDNAEEITCTIACATIGRCVGAWDSNGGCNRGGQLSCDTRRRQLICRCE